MNTRVKEGKTYRVNLGNKKATGFAVHRISMDTPVIGDAWLCFIIEDDAPLTESVGLSRISGNICEVMRTETRPMYLLESDFLEQLEDDPRFEDHLEL